MSCNTGGQKFRFARRHDRKLVRQCQHARWQFAACGNHRPPRRQSVGIPRAANFLQAANIFGPPAR
jgi:hypothetical protein